MTWDGRIVATAAELPLADESVHCIITSPPYWGLRRYQIPDVGWSDGWSGQLGLESEPEQYIDHVVEIFRDLRRVLRSDGTVWLNIGDTFAATRSYQVHNTKGAKDHTFTSASTVPNGLKSKDLVGIPWRVALALQADGWYLRSDVIWAKRNCMPESVEDRLTRSHEYVFLLSKSERYFFDTEAIKEPAVTAEEAIYDNGEDGMHAAESHAGTGSSTRKFGANPAMRQKRDVWFVASQPYPDAHYAVMPPALIEPCLLAGTSDHGVCSQCEKPYSRVLGDPEPAAGRSSGNKDRKYRDDHGGNPEHMSHQAFAVPYEPMNAPTIDWKPGCDCKSGIVPATVLDPFFGSGTVGLVAERFGRRWIGLDLGYQDLQKRRMVQRSLF